MVYNSQPYFHGRENRALVGWWLLGRWKIVEERVPEGLSHRHRILVRQVLSPSDWDRKETNAPRVHSERKQIGMFPIDQTSDMFVIVHDNLRSLIRHAVKVQGKTDITMININVTE